MDLADITIKKDGKWYYGKAEMFRRNILNILARNIERLEDGNYCIRIGQEESQITVEDVPFLATGYLEEDGKIKLVFHDLQEMSLDHEIKLYLKGDVPYISFRWEADTRLSRGVYWKLSEYFDFRGEEIFIVLPQLAGNP
ncbi:MAG: DUF1285 domain-containing protein [Syntrophomonadaceae bacterium]|nr:DUF1285 domain-containing protein [Syntrophomonadaceae bacterium]MDD3271040.1 DUF1285 domain-containing protein [Syntrophomonadaceae bacterium]MDD3897842.1 DUF1285 domain-containing protein [Syntrophomonadaceae bacterium]MDD4562575.1 DUF1285 domain-containing protein [Syntrophomonadaceae bacterium]